MKANGHVYFKDFEKNEQIWASRLEYNTEEKKGKFYDVRGETMPRIVARPGVLPGNSPFHFEGEWAERIGGRYILYKGWVTNCKLPNPWWRLRGPKFEIVPRREVPSRITACSCCAESRSFTRRSSTIRSRRSRARAAF